MRITFLDHLKSLSGKVLEFKPFIEWRSKLQALNQIETTEIIVSDVDLFGDRVGFVKAKAVSKFKDTGSHLPGIAFLRGGAVSILCILHPTEENQEPRVILTQQARIPVGSSSMIELPAGMLDESGDFAGMAAQELKEECGITIRSDQLIDLTGMAFDSEPWVYPSAGGCDEFIKLFLYQEKVPLANILALENRMGGLQEHGERIHLRVVKLSQVWKITRDIKAHSSLYLLEQLEREGKIDSGTDFMPSMDSPAFDGSVALIKKFLKDQEMNETLNAFEKELSQMNKSTENLEMPSILQLAQGYLDLQIKSDNVIAKKSDKCVDFPTQTDSMKSCASVVASAYSDSILYISSTDKVISMYNMKNELIKEPMMQIKQDQVVLSMDIRNNILLTTGMAGRTQLRSIETNEIIYDVKDNTKFVSSCGFSKDGRRFFTGSHDGYFNLYSLESKQKYHAKKFNGVIESCCLIDDVVYISVRGDCFIHLIDLETLEAFEKNMNSNGDDWVSFTALHLSSSPDGSRLLVLTDTPSGRFMIFDTCTWSKVADIWGSLSIDRFSHPRGIWIDSGNFMIGDDEGYLSLWNVHELNYIGKIQPHEAAIRSFTVCESYLCVGSFDHSISVWNLKKDL